MKRKILECCFGTATVIAVLFGCTACDGLPEWLLHRHTHAMHSVEVCPAYEGEKSTLYYCTECCRAFYDEEGTEPVSEEVYEAMTHAYAEEHCTDGNAHWHVCTRCGEESEHETHCGGVADCTNGAVCEVCGTEYGLPDSTCHIGDTELRGVAEATEERDGYSGDIYCLSCGGVVEHGHVLPFEKEPELPEESPEPNEPDLPEESPEPNEPEISERPAFPIVPAEPEHMHRMEYVPYSEPTCDRDGHMSYYSCAECGKCYLDESGKTEARAEDLLLPMTGHSFSSAWEWDEESHWHAADCGHDEVSDREAHTVENGVCTVCGKTFEDSVTDWLGASVYFSWSPCERAFQSALDYYAAQGEIEPYYLKAEVVSCGEQGIGLALYWVETYGVNGEVTEKATLWLPDYNEDVGGIVYSFTHFFYWSSGAAYLEGACEITAEEVGGNLELTLRGTVYAARGILPFQSMEWFEPYEFCDKIVFR